jgi:hypothetical protein
MLFLPVEWSGEDKVDVQVGETEVESPQNVHKTLEILGGVAQAERDEGELE